jgi:hypothetical protein
MNQNLLKKEMPAQAVSQTIMYLINAEYITGQVVNAWCTR